MTDLVSFRVFLNLYFEAVVLKAIYFVTVQEECFTLFPTHGSIDGLLYLPPVFNTPWVTAIQCPVFFVETPVVFAAEEIRSAIAVPNHGCINSAQSLFRISPVCSDIFYVHREVFGPLNLLEFVIIPPKPGKHMYIYKLGYHYVARG